MLLLIIGLKGDKYWTLLYFDAVKVRNCHPRSDSFYRHNHTIRVKLPRQAQYWPH